MISADHPRFSCTSDMSLTIYGKIFSGPLVHTNDPPGTGVQEKFGICESGIIYIHLLISCGTGINNNSYSCVSLLC